MRVRVLKHGSRAVCLRSLLQFRGGKMEVGNDDGVHSACAARNPQWP